jgi:hypothetical protein
MDEASLSANIAGFAPLDFSRPISGDQLAPFGFMIGERAFAWALGPSKYVMRLLPFICGIVSLPLFASLSRRILSERSALVALVLFALSDDLVYYSSELKPYSLDLLIGLALTLGAVEVLGKPLTGRATAALGLAAVAVPWFSFASAFIVGGCGISLLLSSLRLRRYRDAAVLVVIGLAWLASFTVAYRASLALLSPYTTMYLFWDFAFLPLGNWPLGLENLRWSAGILLETFVNPLNLVLPFWRASIVLPVLLMVAGSVALARRSWPACLLLLLPILLAMAASALKRYPLHGRLMLELVPSMFLLVAAGTDVVRTLDRTRMRLLYKAILILLLGYPCFSAVYEATGMRPRWFNAHGDLHDNIFMTMSRQNVGMTTRWPPFMADSWAHRPTMVQLAEVAASGNAGRSPLTALKNACTRWGCEPPWPPPWVNERCCSPSSRL